MNRESCLDRAVTRGICQKLSQPLGVVHPLHAGGAWETDLPRESEGLS